MNASEFEIATRGVRGAASSLSCIGAVLIIGTFIAFKSIRTVPRFMLVNLAVADLITAISFLFETPQDTLCKIQAGLRIFGLNSAIFWTTAIPLYMFIAFMTLKPYSKKVVMIVFVFCWFVPLIVTLWLGLEDLLGRSIDPTRSCFIRILNATDGDNTNVTCDGFEFSWKRQYPILMGYLLWNYLSFFLLPALYIALKCRIWRLKVRLMQTTGGVSRLPVVAPEIDQKLILLPLIYFLLRIGNCIFLSLVLCVHPNHISDQLVILLVVFLEPLQGFVNGMVFVVFTRSIRREVASSLCRARQESIGQIDDIESTTSVNSERSLMISGSLRAPSFK